MNKTIPTQDWLDPSLYPFNNQYIQLELGQMHYVDEGKGEILLFVHGTPTWSFLYRNLIRKLSANYRCIAVDHIGFGLSEKPQGFVGTPQNHAKNLEEFIHALNLDNITLVVHDFGGPIGLAAGIEQADRIKRLVLCNTWLWETKQDKDAQKIDKLVKGWLGRYLYLNFNFSPKYLLKQGFSNAQLLSKAVHQHYIKPFPNKDSRMPLLDLAKALVGSSDWYQAQWQGLDRLVDKEWLILWGMQDKFITTYLEKWKARLPHAKVRELDCGHFVQEEKTSDCLQEIQAFME